MRVFNILSLVVTLVFQAFSAVFAQGAGIEWDMFNQEVMDLYRTGKYDRAVVSDLRKCTGSLL